MKYLILILAVFLTGCNSAFEKLENKAVLVKGYNFLNIVDTGYNPVTKTFTPKFTSIISSGKYLSIPFNETYFLYLEDDESSSIWNSKTKTTNFTFIFATKDKDLAKQALEVLNEKYK